MFIGSVFTIIVSMYWGDTCLLACCAYVLVLLKAWRPSFELVCSVVAALGTVAVAAFWAAGCATASPLYK